MKHAAGPPMTRKQVVDMYFMEHRGKLLDIAAFLDRVDRASPGDGRGESDFRVEALLRAAAVIGDGRPERARRILELLSDPTIEPIAAAGIKGALGAWSGSSGGLGERGAGAGA